MVEKTHVFLTIFGDVSQEFVPHHGLQLFRSWKNSRFFLPKISSGCSNMFFYCSRGSKNSRFSNYFLIPSSVFFKAFSQSSLQTFCSWKNSRFFDQKKSFRCIYTFRGGKYLRFFKHFASCVFMNRSWLKKFTFSWLFFSGSLFLGRKNSRFFKHNFRPVMCCGKKNSWCMFCLPFFP